MVLEMNSNNKIPFIITIDTEGDNLWSHPLKIETKNTKGLYRFQELCNKFGYKPVYLTNYEMAMDDEFVEFGEICSANGQCEIGMHLHAWNSPPLFKLTENDMLHQPFLYEYPVNIIDEKIKYMTNLLRSRFSTKIVTHRAGRWAMSEEYFSILSKYGYLVDCSVTPGVDWSNVKGNPDGKGGADYHSFPLREYFIKDTKLLEVPVSIIGMPRYRLFSAFNIIKKKLPKAFYKVCFQNIWLRPNGKNLDKMKNLVDETIESDIGYLEFMIHSSELSAGLNPYFASADDINKLYSDLEELFCYISNYAEGCTLNEFYMLKCNR